MAKTLIQLAFYWIIEATNRLFLSAAIHGKIGQWCVFIDGAMSVSQIKGGIQAMETMLFTVDYINNHPEIWIPGKGSFINRVVQFWDSFGTPFLNF